MKKFTLAYIFIASYSFAQEIGFKESEIKVMRKTKEQNIPIKIQLKESDKLKTNINITVSQLEGKEIKLNPETITYNFTPTKTEYVFNLQVNNFSESDLKNDESRVILKLLYDFDSDKDGHDEKFEKTLVIKVIPFSESKEELPDDFPKLILFGGTNIDPLGENTVTSGSFNFEYNFNILKKSKIGVQFGLFSNKNFTKDSLTKTINYYAPDILTDKGLIEGKSYVYTQLVEPRISTKTRSNGGYLNFTKQIDTDTDTKYYFIGGGEFIFRKFASSADPKSIIIDSTKFRIADKKEIRGTPAPVSKDRIFIPTRSLNQAFINLGIRIENSSEKVYVILQPMVSWGVSYERITLLNRQINEKTNTFYGGLRTFIVYKPVNVSLLLDMKIRGLESNFINFSIGVPIDVKGIFTKK